VSKEGKLFNTWGGVRAALESNFNPKENFYSRLDNADHGYSIVAIAAAAAAAQEPGGAKAWEWIHQYAVVPAKTGLDANPKWAILPRERN
jgi:hypothetical protein